MVDGVAIKLRAVRVEFERAGSGSKPLRRPADYHRAEGRSPRHCANGALAKRVKSGGRSVIERRSEPGSQQTC